MPESDHLPSRGTGCVDVEQSDAFELGYQWIRLLQKKVIFCIFLYFTPPFRVRRFSAKNRLTPNAKKRKFCALRSRILTYLDKLWSRVLIWFLNGSGYSFSMLNVKGIHLDQRGNYPLYGFSKRDLKFKFTGSNGMSLTILKLNSCLHWERYRQL